MSGNSKTGKDWWTQCHDRWTRCNDWKRQFADEESDPVCQCAGHPSKEAFAEYVEKY